MNDLTPETTQPRKPMRSTVNRWRRLAAGAAIVTVGLVPAAQASAGSSHSTDRPAVATTESSGEHRSDHGDRWSRTSIGLVASVGEDGVEIVKPDGSRTTIPVDDATTVTRTSVGSIADVTVGAQVSVLGWSGVDDSIDAIRVHVRTGDDSDSDRHGRGWGWDFHHGTVASVDAAAGTFTLEDGRTVRTSELTRTTVTTTGTVADLVAGETILVRGGHDDDPARSIRVLPIPIREVPPVEPAPEPEPEPEEPVLEAFEIDRARVTAVDGATFTVDGRRHHDDVAITTNDATAVTVLRDATIDEATVGATVSVKGHERDGVVRASKVTIGGDASGRHNITGEIGAVDPDAGTITVVTPDGGVVVEVTERTSVRAFVAGTTADIAVGAKVDVAGTKADDGTRTAESVHVDLTSGRRGTGHDGWGRGHEHGRGRGHDGRHDGDHKDDDDRHDEAQAPAPADQGDRGGWDRSDDGDRDRDDGRRGDDDHGDRDDDRGDRGGDRGDRGGRGGGRGGR